ncbi:MAG: zinc ribbon domain-containing protein [Proteobacteria bacterium]|nr:zinc ribbon domain-containing protein [Pseudomonadota bacterium]
MPIYEYQCQDCDERVEVLQKISDAPKVDCPACGKPSLKKKMSAVAFRLKGSGWYETDFKTGDKKNLAGDSGKETASPDKKETPKKADTTKVDSKKSSTA